MANHSSQSSLPCHTFHSSQYRLTCQSRDHSQSIQSCETSPPCQTCHGNRTTHDNHFIQPSKTSHTTHSSHSSLTTSNKPTQSSHSSYFIHSSLPIRTFRTIHFIQYIARSHSNLPKLHRMQGQFTDQYEQRGRADQTYQNDYRLATTISMTRSSGRPRMERRYSQNILTILKRFPRLASMAGMTRHTRLTRMARPTSLCILIRGSDYGKATLTLSLD